MMNTSPEPFKPTIYLIMWNGRDGICFNHAPFKTISQMKWAGYSTWSFFGAIATVHVGTQETDLYRSDALKIASDYVKGEYEITDVDLDQLTVTRTKGRPLSELIHPRQ